MYAGNHSKTIIEGVLDNDFELANEYSLTSLKSDGQKFDFSFEDTSGKLVSMDDDFYDGKSIVVQFMGSWCPNCLDESKFYVDYINKNELNDIEFVALAFEYAKTKEAAQKGILKLKNEIGINYPILLAQYGSSDKAKALEKFPMLNNIISYPTTIFLDKNKEVIKIAIRMRQNSYAPYSKYKVGAAVLTDSGEIFGGCNIENSSYSLTCCAERVALFKAYSEGFRTIKALSVSTENAGMPCGACRQVIWELCGDIPLYICDGEGLVSTNNSRDLIPDPFDKTKVENLLDYLKTL